MLLWSLIILLEEVKECSGQVLWHCQFDKMLMEVDSEELDNLSSVAHVRKFLSTRE